MDTLPELSVLPEEVFHDKGETYKAKMKELLKESEQIAISTKPKR